MKGRCSWPGEHEPVQQGKRYVASDDPLHLDTLSGTLPKFNIAP